jgi:hypothetical protein
MTQSYLGEPNFLSNWLVETGKDNYDPIHNPNGYVNLGTAVNALNEAEIESWLLKDGVFQHERKWQHYHQFRFDIRIKSTSSKNNLIKWSKANQYKMGGGGASTAKMCTKADLFLAVRGTFFVPYNPAF